MSSKSLRQAVGLWLQYCNSLLGLLLAVDLREEPDGSWIFAVSELTPGSSVFAFCAEEFFTMGLAIGFALSEKPFVVKQVSFAYRAPAYKTDYQKYFDCPIRFDAPLTSITIRSPSLDVPLRANDEEFVEVCLRHCNQVMRELGDNSSLMSRLRSIFLRNAASLPDVVEAARQLDISERTLRRRLKAEGSSYQKLLNEFRFDLAREYLSAGQMAPKEVGYLLGFKFPSTFGRAFKSWAGQSVRRYQRQVTGQKKATPVVLPYCNTPGGQVRQRPSGNQVRNGQLHPIHER